MSHVSHPWGVTGHPDSPPRPPKEMLCPHRESSLAGQGSAGGRGCRGDKGSAPPGHCSCIPRVLPTRVGSPPVSHVPTMVASGVTTEDMGGHSEWPRGPTEMSLGSTCHQAASTLRPRRSPASHNPTFCGAPQEPLITPRCLLDHKPPVPGAFPPRPGRQPRLSPLAPGTLRRQDPTPAPAQRYRPAAAAGMARTGATPGPGSSAACARGCSRQERYRPGRIRRRSPPSPRTQRAQPGHTRPAARSCPRSAVPTARSRSRSRSRSRCWCRCRSYLRGAVAVPVCSRRRVALPRGRAAEKEGGPVPPPRPRPPPGTAGPPCPARPRPPAPAAPAGAPRPLRSLPGLLAPPHCPTFPRDPPPAGPP